MMRFRQERGPADENGEQLLAADEILATPDQIQRMANSLKRIWSAADEGQTIEDFELSMQRGEAVLATFNPTRTKGVEMRTWHDPGNTWFVEYIEIRPALEVDGSPGQSLRITKIFPVVANNSGFLSTELGVVHNDGRFQPTDVAARAGQLPPITVVMCDAWIRDLDQIPLTSDNLT